MTQKLGEILRGVTWIRSFSLEVARDRQEIFPGVPGGWDFIAVSDSNNATDEVTLHFPERISDGIRLIRGRAIRLRGLQYEKFYMTSPAVVGGSITLFVGGEGGAEFEGANVVEISGDVQTDMLTVAGGFNQDMVRQLGLVNLQTVAAGFTDDITRLLGTINARITEASALFDQGAVSGNIIGNPGAGQIMAETGDRPAGTYMVEYQLGSDTAQSDMRLQVRSTANATLAETLIPMGANTNVSGFLWITLGLNEDVVIIANSALTGTHGAMLTWRRILP